MSKYNLNASPGVCVVEKAAFGLQSL